MNITKFFQSLVVIGGIWLIIGSYPLGMKGLWFFLVVSFLTALNLYFLVTSK